jgi:hypothetical protein
MKKALVTIFSDATNTDLDYTKVLGAIAFFIFLGLSIHAYGFKDKDWDPTSWTTASAILLAAAGGVSKIKDYTGGQNGNKIDETNTK